ncbi:MAG: protease complex subunit PrcB family protein [Solirubrobacterales bacterium]
MLKNLFTAVCITLLTLGIILTNHTVKAAASDEAITCNTNFSIVSDENAPKFLIEEVNLYKQSKGFIYYIDSDSGDLYIAVMLGTRPTPGYSVKVNYLENVEGNAYVSADETCPDQDMMLPQVLSYPYTIIKSELPASKVCVKTSEGKTYDYLGSNGAVPIIGVSWTFGYLQNIYTTDKYIFLEILDSNKETRLFYVSNSYYWKNKLENLKMNTAVSIRFALGTPENYNDLYAFPLRVLNTPIDKNSLTDENWNNMDSFYNVESDKKWTITLNQELDDSALDNLNIYITDFDGNIFPSTLVLSDYKKSITITPYKNYKLGEKYYLFINNNIINTNTSLNGSRMYFQITDSIDIK